MILIRSHGLGNDYLTLHRTPRPLTAAAAIAICDRHTGAGSDGILEPVAPHGGASYGLRIWNPDGSRAEKSGNGLRIFARYLVDHCGASADFTVSVESGVVRCLIDDEAITVEMGTATFAPAEIPCQQLLLRTPVEVDGDTLLLTAVGVGNPHCVIFFPAETELDGLPWRRLGAVLERHALFPNRTNVQFARRSGPQQLEIRIWERGAGETSASGSSSCAVAAAAVRLGEVAAGAIEVTMPGGSLGVTVGVDRSITLRGPVEEVGTITLSERWLLERLGEGFLGHGRDSG